MSLDSLKNLPLQSRSDLQAVYRTLEAAFVAVWDPSVAAPRMGRYRTQNPAAVSRLESVSRILWGLVPYHVGGGCSQAWPLILEAIRSGTNPDHWLYWGDAIDNDQRLVEMAAFGLALRLTPECIWEPLSQHEKDHFASWLCGIVDRELVPNNWQFFRLVVTMGLRHVGRAPANAEGRDRDAMDRLESYDLGEGWYADGKTDQRDYYIPMGFHFYGLLCAVLDPEGAAGGEERSALCRERAAQFAPDFLAWFSNDGAALPFGRSLTYRFAQGAFWAAAAFAEVPGLTPEVVKGCLLRHLRWWLRHEITDAQGILSLGYTYPNLNVIEPYTCSGSTNWALKSFLVLALPESHPFWSSDEEPLPVASARQAQPHARFLINRDAATGHVTALNAGQWIGWPLRFRAGKYAKFAYSTFFGPTYATNPEWLPGAGVDNTLLVTLDESAPQGWPLWIARGMTSGHKVTDTYCRSLWIPAQGVEIHTWLIPLGTWHVRVHRVQSLRPLMLAEGGFAAPDARISHRGDGALCAVGEDGGVTGILDCCSGPTPREVRLQETEPNANLCHEFVRVPLLQTALPAGVHWLASAVLGAAPGSTADWRQPPSLVIEEGEHPTVRIQHLHSNFVVSLSLD
jgi:hypothetical protein